MRMEHTPRGIEHYEDCFLCQREFRYGAHRYAGRPIGEWGILVCELCEKANWDGLVPQSHPRLMKHLAERSIAPKLNDRGWLPIPPR